MNVSHARVNWDATVPNKSKHIYDFMNVKIKISDCIESMFYLGYQWAYLDVYPLFRKNRNGRQSSLKWINLDHLKEFKRCCDQSHSCMEISFGINFTTRPSWLVDVQNYCVVPDQEGKEYIALSYVWGNVEQLSTTTENLDLLRKPGALKDPEVMKLPISKTTSHAISLTRRLKIQYLWVDTLCIVQDDHKHKQSELNNMSSIYANASLTIVAATGNDSNSGLTGLHGISGPREINLQRFDIDTELTLFYEPDHGSTADTWKSRGWTYQEYAFSRRLLFFHDGFVSWQCLRGRQDEFIFTACGKVGRGPINNIDLHAGSLNNCRSLLLKLTSSVAEYNSRMLAYPQDALDAFAGVATALNAEHIGGFISGLPILSFNRALLWQSESVMSRRLPAPRGSAAKDRDESINNVTLPSWSWCGWYSESKRSLRYLWALVDFSYRLSKHGTPLLEIESRLQWKYHQSRTDPGVLISYRWSDYRKKFMNNTTHPVPDGWTRHVTKKHIKHQKLASSTVEAQNRHSNMNYVPNCFYTKYKSEGYTNCQFPLPSYKGEFTQSLIQAPFISCITRRAWFRATDHFGGGGFNRARNNISIRDDDGKWVGLINVQQCQKIRNLPGSRLELIEVAQGRVLLQNLRDLHGLLSPLFRESRHPQLPQDGEYYEHYYVMWIRWENGIAYRLGVGRVLKNAWEEAEKEEIDVMLG
ncbi:hypothetical protein Daesc_000140 [Daldinia eschscholtzii]|uniref:Heterokaryon incompatibility domain-containing protein n=1 Tax=Daldinia eschscholtzii TaxID=292717 RepID=A0AAX6MXV5_9PEZI